MRGILAAAQQGDKMVLQDAIAKKNVGVVDEEATTPLMYAAASGREEILRLLLEKEVHNYESYDVILGASDSSGGGTGLDGNQNNVG